jgi:hypothetical protein
VLAIKEHQTGPALLFVYCLLCSQVLLTFLEGIRIVLADLHCFGCIPKEPEFRNIGNKQEVAIYEYTMPFEILQVRY